jgi:hypothetical protein
MTVEKPHPAAPSQGELPPLLARYEVKYTVPFSQIAAMVDFISPYCSMDRHSIITPGGFYKVNSLYFDTPDFLFLRQRINRCETRFNMRVRCYGDAPTLPYFLEIKRRTGDTVVKHRAKIFDEELEGPLTDRTPLGTVFTDATQRSNAEFFCRTAHRYNAVPQVLVQYERLAFISECDDYARVTFDTGLRWMEQHRYSPLPIEEGLAPCDVETAFDPGTNVILELKCYTSTVPLWMLDFVRAFQLQRRGFSKYSTCMKPIFANIRGVAGAMGLLTATELDAYSREE